MYLGSGILRRYHFRLKSKCSTLDCRLFLCWFETHKAQEETFKYKNQHDIACANQGESVVGLDVIASSSLAAACLLNSSPDANSSTKSHVRIRGNWFNIILKAAQDVQLCHASEAWF